MINLAAFNRKKILKIPINTCINLYYEQDINEIIKQQKKKK